MKLLVITNLYPPHEIGGYELRCRDICERLRKRGHELRILTSDHQIDGRPDIDQPHVRRALRINGMYGNPWRPIHRLLPIELHNHRQLQQQIEEFKPDLIHVWNMGGISKSLLLRIEKSGIPIVYDISDHWIARSLRADVWLAWWNQPTSLPARLIRAFCGLTGIRRWLSSRAPTDAWQTLKFPRIYFCSSHMRDTTVSKGWPVQHAAVIHCGIDTAAFDTKTNHQAFDHLLWVGRIAPDKDPTTAVRALAQCKLEHLRLSLYGHGKPEDVAALRQEIKELGLQDRVEIKSAPADEMRHIYARHDALLFTSNWGEPFALTPLEAMASGLPVITSLDGGQLELAKDGDNSLVATAGEPDTYATQIRRMADSPELRHSIASRSLEQVRREFDLEVITDQIEAYLNQSLRA